MSYLTWDSPGVEVIQPGEDNLKEHVACQFNQLQQLSFQKTARCMRAIHLKIQGCVHGTMKITDGLPGHLAQGLFSKPGKHDLVILFYVPGEKLFGNANTQDFTFINYRILELRDIPGSSKLADSLIKNYDDLSKFSPLEAAAGDEKIGGGFTSPAQRYMTSIPQWSQGAYRYRDYVAKFGVFPTGTKQLELRDTLILDTDPDTDPVTVLSDSSRAFHKENVATFSFQVQLLENLKDQPVEDLGIEWDEQKYPFQEVGTIEIPNTGQL